MSLINKVVYRHVTSDTNKVFYVGIGTKSRPFTKSKRSAYWQNITKKHGYRIEIIAEDLLFEDAVELEEFLISIYGRLDIKTGCLCNLTDGGEGTTNVTQEAREKISASRKGVRNLPIDYKATQETCKKISDARKGKTSTFKGKFHTEKNKALIREKRKLQTFNKETLLKKSEAVKGGKNPFSRKAINIETNEIFDTIKEAADSISIARTYLSSMLSGKLKNTTKILYYEHN